MDNNALKEIGKSFLRFLWFGILGLIVTFLTNLVASGQLENITVVVYGQSVNLSILVLAVITGLIKLIDRYRHVSDKTESNGIAPGFLQR